MASWNLKHIQRMKKEKEKVLSVAAAEKSIQNTSKDILWLVGASKTHKQCPTNTLCLAGA